MRAHVCEDAHLSVGVTYRDDRPIAQRDREAVTRVGNLIGATRREPRCAEHALDLSRVDRGVDVVAGYKSSPQIHHRIVSDSARTRRGQDPPSGSEVVRNLLAVQTRAVAGQVNAICVPDDAPMTTRVLLHEHTVVRTGQDAAR